MVNELDELSTAQVVKKPELKVEEKEEAKAPAKKVVEKNEENDTNKWNEETPKVEAKKEAKEEKKAPEKKVAEKKEVKKEEKKEEKKEVKKEEKEDPLIQKHTQMLQFCQNLLGNMEMDIKRVKLVLNQLTKFDPKNPDSLKVSDKSIEEEVGIQEVKNCEEDSTAEVVEGTFDGYFMVGKDQKKYPVPLNYSSKTKMVPGDALKLKIMSDGRFIYKLVQPAERKHIRAVLSKADDGKHVAVTDEGKMFFLNQAAVTFHKGRPGDELYIVTNKDESGGFAAIEAVIKK